MRTFQLDEQEEAEAKAWIEEHNKTCPRSFKNRNLPATGEHYYYKFIPGGLGNSVIVGCIYCNESKDVTNTGNW